MSTTVLNTKISEDENKISDNFEYITTRATNKSAAEIFAARIKQTDSVNKTDFDNKLTSFNKRITSNKTNHLEFKRN